MKSTLSFHFLLLLFSSGKLWAASQMYSVTAISTMQVTAHVQGGKNSELKLQVIDVVSGKRVWISLDGTSKPGIYEGHYQIDIKGKSGELPILQFSANKKILFVKSDPKNKKQILDLYENEKDVPAVVVSVAKATALTAVKGAQPSSPTPEAPPEDRKVLDQQEIKKQEEERMSLEAQEALRREALLKQQQEMSEELQRQRKEKSAKLVTQASSLYTGGQYDQASQLFAEAVELDPGNGRAYYQYGVSLYKTNQYNKSLAVLAMAEGGPQSVAEHNYYVALNHLKLQESEKALDKFRYVRDENDPQLSATASFLAGTIEFQKELYTEARKSFNYTLDQSKDPEIDRQSEDMLEQIDQIENYNASAKDKLSYSLNLGASYDGNVLNTARQNITTDVEAYRLSYGGSLIYKIFQSFKTEWSAVVSASDIYSVDKTMTANATLQAADPLVYSISSPFRTQISTKTKSFLVNVTPAFSVLTMNVENNERKPILQSATLGSDVSFQIAPTWMSTYKLELNKDNSFLSSATDDDQTALRTTAGTVQTKLLDPKATRTLAGDLNYVSNQASGKNNNYTKTSLGVTYSFPGPSKYLGTVRGELASQKYIDNINERLDTTYTLSLGANKSLQKSLSINLSLQMVGNSSNVEANRYDKMLVSALLTYTGSLIRVEPKGSN